MMAIYLYKERTEANRDLVAIILENRKATIRWTAYLHRIFAASEGSILSVVVPSAALMFPPYFYLF